MIMKKLAGLILLFVLTLGVHAEGSWMTDFEAAKKKAKEENKKVLMLFTGSDWCAYCIKWEKEVFKKPEFAERARDYVLLMVDFPEEKPLPKEQQKANDALLDKFNIKMYPTVLVLNSKGKKVGKFNFMEGGIEPFFAKLNAIKE